MSEQKFLTYLKDMSPLFGVSGDEAPVREYIKEQLKGKVDEMFEDALGSLVVLKKGKSAPKQRLMIDAHIDEVGFMVSEITEDGYLKFQVVGSINDKVILGRRVYVGEHHLPGVIGTKPIHLQSAEEKKTPVPVEDMYIDIGANDRAQAEQYVMLGDRVMFDSEFVEFGDHRIKGKAFDDRAAVALLMELAQSDLKYDTWFSFSTQEEIGGYGAKTAAARVNPDLTSVVETTSAADVPFIEGTRRTCIQKQGPSIVYADKKTIYPRDLFKHVFALAKEQGIKVQPKTSVAGSTNAGIIRVNGCGAKAIGVSMPCRYIHSGSCMLCTEDMEETYRLLKALTEELQDQEW